MSDYKYLNLVIKFVCTLKFILFNFLSDIVHEILTSNDFFTVICIFVKNDIQYVNIFFVAF